MDLESLDSNGRQSTQTPHDIEQDRLSIAARLGISGDFMRVPQLAKVLGISANSIHAQMRSGKFPMPHRRVGNVVVVKLDDYIAWFCSDGVRPNNDSLALPSDSIAGSEHFTIGAGPAIRLSPREKSERLKLEVRQRMQRKGFKV